MIASLSIENLNVCIDHLNHHPEFLNEINGWLFKEWTTWYEDWGINNEKAAFKDLIKDINRSKREGLPIMIVAYVGTRPIGCIGLDKTDMPNPPKDIIGFGPWIVNVYVIDEFRGKGLGSILVKTMMDSVKENKIKNVYLLTDNKKGFYERLGWVEKGIVKYLDKLYFFMEFKYP